MVKERSDISKSSSNFHPYTAKSNLLANQRQGNKQVKVKQTKTCEDNYMKILKNPSVKNNFLDKSSTNNRLFTNQNSSNSMIQLNNQRTFKFNSKSDSISNLIFPNQPPAQQQYELRGYINGNQSVLNTAPKKNNQVQLQSQKPKNVNNEIFLTTTIEKMIKYQELPQIKNSNVLFEIIAQLDSVLTDYPNNGRVFSIRDSSNNFNDNSPSNLLKCVFYEIDRKLFGLVRRSYIRCVGQYNVKKKIFLCFSVRSAFERELVDFQNSVIETDELLFDN